MSEHYENYLRYKAAWDAKPKPFTASQQETPPQYLPYARYPLTPAKGNTMPEVTPDNLNALMEFDHVIRVNQDGTVSDSPLDPYFSLCCNLTSEDHWEDEFSIEDGWELMNGYSGQHGYSGPVMHVSEYIGGGMAKHILETPGDYVALSVESFCGYTEKHCTEESGCDCFPAGWAVAFKPATLATEGN